ncbi:transcriptional repressor DicA [uncultured Clostridium sp.]|uniref:helix-turn-helix domain-containing protein n=1 Tax=Dorea acetigenes TaxID=2981787 RepID=UPI000820ED73|nr:transcriptional repressor DicA [uncultured Clostridium sp.]
MAIGDIIRKYRKNKGMTQEEMAACLGVTTPAVNKWEKGNTLPDITLLVPIARLLGITTDELLSFKIELADEEINQYLSNVQKDLENKIFHIWR